MNAVHTEACAQTRAGHRLLDRPDEPDEYPEMNRLSDEGRAAVLACPHRDHDVVRLYCQAAS